MDAVEAPLHQCAAIGCEELVDARLLMCRPHWALVPRYLQEELRRSFRFGQESGKRQASVAWLDAADRAIAAVADAHAAA